MQVAVDSPQATMPQANIKPKLSLGGHRPSPTQRAAFASAIDRGLSARQASIMVGVSRETGRLWAQKLKAKRLEQQSQTEILDKSKLAAKLSQDILDASVPAQHRATSGTLLAKLQGYISKEEASDPTQPRRPLRELVVSWWGERAERESAQRPSVDLMSPNKSINETAPLRQSASGETVETVAAASEPGSPQPGGDELVLTNSPPATKIPEMLVKPNTEEVGK